jgi:hypothetical protein
LAVFVLALIGLRGEIAAAGGAAQASRSATVGISGFVFHPPKMTVGVSIHPSMHGKIVVQ